MIFLDSKYIRQYPESPKHPADTFQTPQNLVRFGCGRSLGEKAIAQYDDFYSTLYDLFDIYTPPDIC